MMGQFKIAIISAFIMLGVSPSLVHSYSEAVPKVIDGAFTITTEQAKNLYNQGALFIDVRSVSDWEKGHINGSIHLDVDDEFIVLYISNLLDKNAPIVFYCNSPLSNKSAMASFFAVSWGYDNVHFYREGYFSWLAYDYPVDFKNTLH